MTSDPRDVPPGVPVEIEFLRESKPNERGIVPGPVDYDARGFELVVLRVPDNLSFGQPFRVEWVRKWVNLAGVSELRYLPEETLTREVGRLRELHESVRAKMASAASGGERGR